MIRKEEIVDYFKEYEELKIEAIPRELEVPLDSKFIVSIIGPRRAGKTYYLHILKQKVEDAVFLNFEDSRLYETTYKEIRDIIRIFIELYGKTPKFLFLDEIQNVEKWEVILRELYDLEKYRIFITGSSSKLLSKEIATQLRGRCISFLLLPFNFKEFLSFKKFEIKEYISKDREAKIKNLLREYLKIGGFPDVIKSKEKLRILKEYSDLVLFRDFIERHKIRNFDLARAIHLFVLQNFSQEISLKSLFDKLKSLNIRVAKDSVYEYVTMLEDTLFFFFLRKFSSKVHLRETWPKKIYVCDTGLTRVTKFSPNYGSLIENLVFLELIREKNLNPLLEIFYLKFNDGEVDFVLKEGLRIRQLIQVSYVSSRNEIEKREIKALIKASELLKCKDLLFITWDFEDEIKVKNRKIKFLPLWKWLLS